MLEAVSLPDWPLFGLADDVRPALSDIVRLDRPAVLATLYRVVGGSPRPAGSQMLIAPERLSGFMSGGCIEADIAAHAARVAETGQPQHLVYGDGGPYPDIRLVCGGRVEILLERIRPHDGAVRTLLNLADARRPALWVSDGDTRACWHEAEPPPALSSRLAQAAQDLEEAPSRRCANADGLALGLRFNPVKRMIVVGGDPTAIAIASLASQSGFETWLVRSKGPEAPPPVPGVAYDRRTPDVALPAIGLDPWTYVAVATHDFESDEAALTTALPSDAAYVGVLGARRRLPERLARLTSLGVPPAALARMKAPIGLNLGGKAPFEIAIAVLAEVIAHRPDTDRKPG
ncbi:MAG: XdhC family protein [Caulobacteraceae bacterium]